MSCLSTAFQRETERLHLNQSDIARGAGLSRSYISRVFSGASHELSDRNFIAILKVFCADAQAQAELIAARCMDAREGASAAGMPGAELVEIKVKGVSGKHETVSEDSGSQVQLARETERAFAWLRSQCPLNPDLEKHLVGYARLTGMK
jgi:transcriptional regulator with XRE-family HTH domain